MYCCYMSFTFESGIGRRTAMPHRKVAQSRRLRRHTQHEHCTNNTVTQELAVKYDVIENVYNMVSTVHKIPTYSYECMYLHTYLPTSTPSRISQFTFVFQDFDLNMA